MNTILNFFAFLGNAWGWSWRLFLVALGASLFSMLFTPFFGFAGSGVKAELAGVGFFCVGAALAVLLVAWRFGWPGWGESGAGGSDHLRGAALAAADDVEKMVKREKEPFDLQLGGIPIPRRLETLNFMFSGGPGQGKSVAITTLLDGVSYRPDRAIIADSGGIFTTRYYQPARGDIILNPLDERARAWSPLAEIKNQWDPDRLAAAFIPRTGGGNDATWNRQASELLGVILRHCHANNLPNGEIVRLFLAADLEELREVCQGTASYSQVAEGNERMAGSIRATGAPFLSALQYLDPDAGKDAFSITEWVKSGGAGWAFINYQDTQLDLLRPVIAAMLDTFSLAVLDLPPDMTRMGSRIWLVLDELASLGQINSLNTYLSKSSKNGGCCIAGIQSVAQLKHTYGREMAHTLMSCLGSWLVLKSPDPETADYLSRFLGDEQIRRVTNSGGEGENGSHKNWSEQVVSERIVLPGELQNLPPLCGYFNLSGHYPTAPIRLALPGKVEPVAESFIPRPLHEKPQPEPKQQEPGREAGQDDRGKGQEPNQGFSL